MIFYRSSVALFLLLLPDSGAIRTMTGMKVKMNNMKANSCEKNGRKRKCAMDVSGFSLDSAPGEVSMMDLGPGRNYACTSKGAPMGTDGAAYHAECKKVNPSGRQSGAKADAVPGAMNAVLRGKNSDGEDLMYASMSVDDEVCRIGPDSTGMSSVMECLPADEFPPEDDPQEAQDHEMPPPESYGAFGQQADDHGGAGRSLTGLRGQQRGLQDNNVMDIMVVWTRKAECRSNGLPANCAPDGLTDMTEANIRGLIDLAVFETNTAFDNSGVSAELRLVHAYRDETYDESAGASAALEDITFDNDGVLDDVHDKRAMVGADLVALIGSDFTSMGLCGVAWLGPSVNWMFSVTDWSCATGVFTFGHEIGHNMGCLHDKGNQQDCGTNDSNYGYLDPDARYRTILGTDCRSAPCSDQTRSVFCPRVQYYSTPNALVDGNPLGNATIDNAQRINSVASIISNFFPEVPQCTQDSDCDDQDPCTTNVCDGACVFDPVDCDDGDVCTTDSCSAGTCVNADISSTCDDGNPCTADTCDAATGCSSAIDTSLSCDDGDECTNDSCGVDGECVSTPVMGCCGNGICEDGEQGTCLADCLSGPFTLAGPLCSSCFGLEGNMFDVEARGQDITVTNFKIRYFQGSNVEVWTREGTHNGFAFSAAGWTRIATHTISGASRFTMVEIPESSFTQSVQISAGATQAFYVTLTWGDVLYHRVASSLNAVVAQDDNLIMYEGPAKLYPFRAQTGPRVFNGQIVYKKGGATFAQDPVVLGPISNVYQELEEAEGEDFIENVVVERELIEETSGQ